jgi:hypothetical protein
MKNPLYCSLVAAAALGLMCLGCQANNQTAGAHGAAAPVAQHIDPPVQGDSISGKVDSYNVDANGMYTSLNLTQSDGRVVQLNFPPVVGPTIAKAVKVGDEISTTASPRLSMPDHPVYAMVSLKSADGKTVDVTRKTPRGQAQVQGKIARFNYGPQGRVNGFVLDSGETVLVGPQAAQKLGLQVGQNLTAQGGIRPALEGTVVITATRINDKPVGPPMGRAAAMGQGNHRNMRRQHQGRGRHQFESGRMGGHWRHHHHHHMMAQRRFWMHMWQMHQWQMRHGPMHDGQMRGNGQDKFDGRFGDNFRKGPWGMNNPGIRDGGMGGWGMHRPGMDGNRMNGGRMDGGGMPPRFGPQSHHGPRPTTGPANWHGGASDNSHPGDQAKGGGSNEPANPNGMGQ